MHTLVSHDGGTGRTELELAIVVEVEALGNAGASGRIIQGSSTEQRLLEFEQLKLELLEVNQQAGRSDTIIIKIIGHETNSTAFTFTLVREQNEG
jgi:hypothetical protein